MGLLNEADWQGQWIGWTAPPRDSETQWSRLAARYLRKEFALTKEVKRATVHIAGMGLYELFINGQRIGEQVPHLPLPITGKLSCTTRMTSPPTPKENAIGVILGNGRFYTMRQNYKPYKIPTFGYPKLRLNLIVEYTDGSRQTIASDISPKLTTEGPIRSNNEYDGEEYDARKELETGIGQAMMIRIGYPLGASSIPSGTLRAQMMPDMKVTESLKPVSIRKQGDKQILDIGQNMAGWLRIRIKGQAGDSIRLRFCRALANRMAKFLRRIYATHIARIYMLSADVNHKMPPGLPCFVYHGFRYVEISGYPNAKTEDFTAEVVDDEMAHTGPSPARMKHSIRYCAMLLGYPQ